MRIIIAMIILLGSNLLNAQLSPEEYGEKLLEEEKYTEAIDVYNQILERDPLQVNPYIQKAICFRKLLQKEAFLKDIAKGIEQMPDSVDLYFCRIDNLIGMNGYGQATKDLELVSKLVKTDKEQSIYLHFKADLLLFKQKFEKAEELLLKAEQLDSTNYAIHNSLAMLYDDIKDFEKAKYHLKKAVTLNPGFIMAYNNLGFIYQNEGNYVEAIENFDQLIELKPKEPFVYSNRAYCYLKIGAIEEALEDVNYSLKIYSSNSFAYKNRALIYLAMKKPKAACKDLNFAKQLGFSKRYGTEVEELLEKHCDHDGKL